MNISGCARQVLVAPLAGWFVLADFAPTARAQTPGFIPVTNAAGYSQNFDVMGPDGSNTPSGWYVGTTGAAISGTNVVVSDGSSSANGSFNFGTTGQSDRALGSLQSGLGQVAFEARFENLSSSFIVSFNIDYAGEQWRLAGPTAPDDVLQLFYSTNGVVFEGIETIFTPEYNFHSPRDSGTAGPLDGNLPTNRVTGLGDVYTPVSALTTGQTFYLRWHNGGGISTVGQGMGIDDFTITFTFSNPPPIVVTLPATTNGTTITVNGTFDPQGLPTMAWFDWGATTNLGNTTTAINIGNGWAPVNLLGWLTGLVSQTYYFRAAASNSLGVFYGSNVSFQVPLFTLVTNPIEFAADGAWGDYDNDGRLDIAIANSSESGIWRNTGSGFTNINADLPEFSLGSVAWGDYDNDGLLDLLFCTYDLLLVYRNTGAGFTVLPTPSTAGTATSASWGDYNNDGRLDFLWNTSLDSFGNSVDVWKNTTNGFTRDIAAGSFWLGPREWGDFNNDGRLDILIAGSPDFTKVAQNNGGSFSSTMSTITVVSGTAAWGDQNNDGLQDIVVSGLNGTNPVCELWRSTGSGFTKVNFGLPSVSYSSSAWGDYDNDGRLDLLLSGNIGGTNVCQVWRNSITGFTNTYTFLNFIGSVAWGDYDSDGRLDVLLAGNPDTQVWRNNTPVANTPPNPPTALNWSVSNLLLTLTWNSATDNETPSAGLTYNVRIGTTPGGSDVLGPMASTSGLRRLPQFGSARHSLKLPFNYEAGRSYYCSVQAVDSAFAGSSFSSETNFKHVLMLVNIPVATPNPSDLTDGVISESEFVAVLNKLNSNGVVSESMLNLVLSNYWPYSPFLDITNTAGLGSTNVVFQLPDPTLGAFGVEVSTNMTTWHFRGPASPRYFFNDTNTPLSTQRFYRLRWP